MFKDGAALPDTQTMTMQNQCGDAEAWRLLHRHKQQVAGLRLSDAFEKDPGRAQRFSLELQDLFVDFSKNLITDETRSLLLKLAEERELKKKIHELFAGGKVNKTEDRPALHTLLRAPEDYSLELDGVDLSRQAQDDLGRMFAVVEALRAGQLKGASGETISKVVNIGIGGSDLGPRLLSEALWEFRNGNIEVEFVANMDPFDIEQTLARSTPNATLFVIVSKSFATPETLANANRAKTWLLRHASADPGKHFIAISENLDAARQFGVSEQRCFKIWDWVGGRYSVWSCAGLTAAAALGVDNFKRFLAGAHVVDSHFHAAELDKNIPAIPGIDRRLAQQLLWPEGPCRGALRSKIEVPARLFKPADYGKQWQVGHHGRRRRGREHYADHLGRRWQQRATCVFSILAPGAAGDIHRFPVASDEPA